MEVFKKTISAVFTGERRYAIPLFQRPYVWAAERQWQPLWDDIVERAEPELIPSQAEIPPHFLGAIVIQQRASWGDELLAHDVIDGQQRLTTFQILLTAFRDIALAIDDKQVATSLESWIRNANPMADPDVEQFKLWPTSRDVQQFRLVSTAGSRAAVELAHPAVYKRKRLLPRPRMVEAYLFFHEAIDRWLRVAGPEKVVERARGLRRVFDRRLQLVSIELEQREDPQVIFETLNARGVPLLASDLLRNYIFQRADSPDDAERLHEAHWSRFEIADNEALPDGLRFWEIEERQGRLTRARLDLFVQHYLSMKRGSDILTARLFPEYKDWIENHAEFTNVESELRDFGAFADHFFALLRPSPTTLLGRFAIRLRAVDTSTVYPLVLALLGNPSLQVGERDGILADIESFLVRRLVCGRPTKNYNRLFLQLLRDFGGKNDLTRAAFRSLLAAGTGEAVDWPDDHAFRSAWATVDAYRELKPARVEMILRAINEALVTAVNESITIHDKLTVEHVMPQDWEDHWPLPQGLDPTQAAETRNDVVHDFGNLTLLTHPLNSSVSNGPATQKLSKIALQSALRLNTYFQSRTSWSESDIGARSDALFDVAVKVWPGP